jgi:hypothetical protein
LYFSHTCVKNITKANLLRVDKIKRYFILFITNVSKKLIYNGEYLPFSKAKPITKKLQAAKKTTTTSPLLEFDLFRYKFDEGPEVAYSAINSQFLDLEYAVGSLVVENTRHYH